MDEIASAIRDLTDKIESLCWSADAIAESVNALTATQAPTEEVRHE